MRVDSTKKRRSLLALGATGLASLLLGLGLLPSRPSLGDPITDSSATSERGEKNMSAVKKMAGKVTHVDADGFTKVILESKTPVLVDFYADWCRPCQMLTPVLEDLARENKDVRVIKVNIDDSPELADEFGIRSIPSLLVFHDRRLVGQHHGLADKAALRRLLRR